MHLVSGRPAAAAIYPQQICESMVEAVDVWLKSKRESDINGFESRDLCDPKDDEWWGEEQENGYYWDDIKEVQLDAKLTRAARAEELKIFRERRVYDVVPRERIPRLTRASSSCCYDRTTAADPSTAGGLVSPRASASGAACDGICGTRRDMS